jgi:hypothetical protein
MEQQTRPFKSPMHYLVCVCVCVCVRARARVGGYMCVNKCDIIWGVIMLAASSYAQRVGGYAPLLRRANQDGVT